MLFCCTMRFVVECRHCQQPIVEAEGSMEPIAPLEAHLRACHPEVTLPEYVGPLLTHFSIAGHRVSPEGKRHVAG